MAAAGADWGQSLDCFYKVSCLGLGHSSTTNGLKLDLRLNDMPNFQTRVAVISWISLDSKQSMILKQIGFFEKFYMFVQKLLYFLQSLP